MGFCPVNPAWGGARMGLRGEISIEAPQTALLQSAATNLQQ
jgi:hypothetical protein